MELAPTPAVKLYGNGRYDAFPSVATDGKSALAVWRSATEHVADPRATMMGAQSADGGKTWGFPYALTIGSALNNGKTEESPAGVAWDDKRSLWVMLTLVKNFVSTTDTKVASYGARILTSTDGRVWALACTIPVAARTGFSFASDIDASDGVWRCFFYGTMPGQSTWQPIMFTCGDGGASGDAGWLGPSLTQDCPPVSLSEPRVTHLANSEWLMLCRCDVDYQSRIFRSQDGFTWVYEGTAVGNVSGQPSVAQSSEGTIVALFRQRPAVDTTHGLWVWASSDDNGKTWQTRSSFPDKTRYMMYGGLAAMPNGDIVCVFSSEDDPKRLWGTASIYATTFVYVPVRATIRHLPSGLPYVSVTSPPNVPVIRRMTDPITGTVYEDEVRWKNIAGGGVRDYELPQEWVATYTSGDVTTKPVTLGRLARMWLIHPTRPDMSCPVDVVTDGARDYDVQIDVTPMPATFSSGMGLPSYPVVTGTGGLGSASGTTVLRTRTLVDKAKLLALWADMTPLLFSAHLGADMPDWIRIIDKPQEERFQQICSPTVNDPDDQGQWRTWTIKWVEQPRPTADGFPVRRRIQDIDVPIQDIDLPIRSI